MRPTAEEAVFFFTQSRILFLWTLKGPWRIVDVDMKSDYAVGVSPVR